MYQSSLSRPRRMSTQTLARIIALHGSARRALNRVEIDVVGGGGWGRAGALASGASLDLFDRALPFARRDPMLDFAVGRFTCLVDPRRLAALTALRDKWQG